MRVNKNVPQKERRRFSLDHFGGVDFGSSPLLCDPHRSPDAVNFIGDHGINRKRNGWEQVVERLDGAINGIYQADKDTVLINRGFTMELLKRNSDGIWSIEQTSNEKDDNIVHGSYFKLGGHIYRTNVGGTINWYSTKTQSLGNGIGGAYIPTTTININPDGTAEKRSSKDMPNIRTPYRRNTLVGTSKPEEGSITWTLDSYVDISTKYSASKVFIMDIERYDQKTGSIETISAKLSDDVNQVRYKSNIVVENEIGTYTKIGEVFGNKISLDIDCTPEVEDVANITVTFSMADKYVKRGDDYKYDSVSIEKCGIGMLFGIGGNRDRVFLSGHPDHPNVVFFSHIDDVSYFPDEYTITLGGESSKIISMMELGNDTLSVFSEDSGIFNISYIRGSYRNIYDDAGNIKKVIPVFSIISTESISTIPTNQMCSLNFHGDNIFLSRNGVYGIEAQQNIASDIRVARDRSYAINKRLSTTDLSNAVGIVHGSKCYFSDGASCYVADAAYKYVPEGALSYNYEWWYWEDIEATSFGIVDGELWFGTKEGRICRFTDLYKDCVFDISKDGDIGVDKSNTTGALVCNDTWLEYLKTRGNRVRLITEGLMGRVASTTVDEEDSTLLHIVDPSYEDDIYDGQFVYIHYEGASDDVRSEVYCITNCDRGERTMSLEKDGQIVSFEKGITVNAYMDLSERDLYVVETVDESKLAYIGISPDGGPLFVSGYHRPGKIPSNLILKQYIESNVSASWTTPPLDLGNDSIAKCLYTMTVTAETGKNAKFKFGYDTRMGRMERASQGLGAFSFDNIDFRDLSFETGFQNSFTVRARERNFNFIRFNIKSDEDAPCAVHRISAVYKYNKNNKGVV